MTSKPFSTSDDPRIVARTFVPSQLTRAREMRCLTMRDLATVIEKTPSAISQFEAGRIKPDHETVVRLSFALGVRPSFFARDHFGSFLSPEECQFRSLRSASQSLRRQAVRIGELLHELIVLLESEGVEFPSPQLVEVKGSVASDDDIESLAMSVRVAWGLGQGPILSPIPLVEAFGVRVLPLPPTFEKVDAFSFWNDGYPFIVLDMGKPPSRLHFDIAHELGHLLMHEESLPGDSELERQADTFASSFLMPRETFGKECPLRWNLADFLSLKTRWHVSVQAALYRAHKLGRISPASNRRAYQMLNARGFRKNEPGEWKLDAPRVLAAGLNLVAEDVTLAEVADRLGLHKSHFRELLSAVDGLEWSERG